MREEPGFGLARAQFSVWCLVRETQGLVCSGDTSSSLRGAMQVGSVSPVPHTWWSFTTPGSCLVQGRPQVQVSGLSAQLASIVHPDLMGLMAFWSLAARHHCEYSVWPRICDSPHRERPNFRFL